MIPYHQEYFGACSSHDLETVKRLYPKLNSLEHRMVGFRKACLASDLVITKWIYDQKDMTKEFIEQLKKEAMPESVIDWLNTL